MGVRTGHRPCNVSKITYLTARAGRGPRFTGRVSAAYGTSARQVASNEDGAKELSRRPLGSYEIPGLIAVQTPDLVPILTSPLRGGRDKRGRDNRTPPLLTCRLFLWEMRILVSGRRERHPPHTRFRVCSSPNEMGRSRRLRRLCPSQVEPSRSRVPSSADRAWPTIRTLTVAR